MAVKIVKKSSSYKVWCTGCGVLFSVGEKYWQVTCFDSGSEDELCDKCKKKYFPNVGRFGWVK